MWRMTLEVSAYDNDAFEIFYQVPPQLCLLNSKVTEPIADFVPEMKTLAHSHLNT